MEKRDIDIHNVKEAISFTSFEEMANASIAKKGEMFLAESSEVNVSTPDSSIDAMLINSNETIPYPIKEKGQESVNVNGTPFIFVGMKMEKTDDYESQALFENPETKCFSEQYPRNNERIDDQCLEGKLPMKSNISCIEMKMEREEDSESCKSDFQTNEDMPMTIDENNKIDFRTVVHGCDMGHSSNEFIRSIECQEYPILRIEEEEEEEEKIDEQIAVNRKNSVKMEEQEKPDDLYCCAAADLEYNIEEYPYSSDDDNKKGIVEEDNNFSTETKSIKAESEEEEVDVCELNCQSTENIFITKTFESQCGSYIYSIEMEVSCHELPRLIKAKVVSTPKSELCFRSIPE